MQVLELALRQSPELCARVRLRGGLRKEEQCDGTLIQALSKIFELSEGRGIASSFPGEHDRNGLLDAIGDVVWGVARPLASPDQNSRVDRRGLLSHRNQIVPRRSSDEVRAQERAAERTSVPTAQDATSLKRAKDPF